MINLFIQGIKEGEHDIEMDVPVEEVPEMFPEYFGNIHIEGKLRKIGNRYSFIAEADCMSKLICDRSLKEYNEEISVEIKLSFMAASAGGLEKFHENEIIINPEDKNIDISYEVREIFGVNLPMKRVAPEYRNVDFKDLYPEYSAESVLNSNDSFDERWAPLKKLIK